MPGKNVIYFFCPCGHEAVIEDWPDKWKNGAETPSDEALARMRCTKCGRKGSPNFRIVWSQPDGEGYSR